MNTITICILTFYIVYIPILDKVCITCRDIQPCKVLFMSREDVGYHARLPFELYHDLYVLSLACFPKEKDCTMKGGRAMRPYPERS